MVQATDMAAPIELRLGEGEFPAELDRVNFGAFLLGVLWAPWHRLWGWFAVLVAMEILESVVGLTMLRFLGGMVAQIIGMVVFRIGYWTVMVVFGLRANRLVWNAEERRVARAGGSPSRRPALITKYVAAERVWAVVGLVLLALAPLSLLFGFPGSRSDVMFDVVSTIGTQIILMIALFVYDRMWLARDRSPR